ncbi:MAG: heme-binding protein [Candidatus Methylomirabilota bacterium]
MTWLRGMGIALVLLAMAGSGHAQVVDKKTLTLDGAKQIIAAAMAEARRLNAPGGVIAVVDDGGNLIALERLDNTFPAGANISIGKARTAAIFKRPTSAFEEIINKGRTTMVALSDFTPLQGGVPIVMDGQVVGAVGVSGAASAKQDEEIAIAAAGAAKAMTARAASAQPAAVTFIDSKMVAAAFAKGAVLVGNEEHMMHASRNYMVHASRRDAAGMAEIHDWDTDIIHILEGTATFVTGGTVLDPKPTGPGEIRGKSIQSGESRRLVKGDVIIVPNGTPHWFQEVQGPFLYYVVKVR